MARLNFRFSVVDGRSKKVLTFKTTEAYARMWIIDMKGFNGKMWVKNNETGLLIGLVNRYDRSGKIEYYYETTDGKERRIKADGTFFKKAKKNSLPFGL